MVAPAELCLAIDSALLINMHKKMINGERCNPILRTYQFSNPTIILGNKQSIRKNIDLGKLKQKGIDITMRTSGGGHMFYTPNDIHFSFITPISFLESSDIYDNYQQFNKYISDCLNSIGYSVKLGSTSIRLSNNKLVCGTAQKRTSRAVLHHGGIISKRYDKEVFGILGATDEERDLLNEITSFLPVSRKLNDFLNSLYQEFSNSYKKSLEQDEISMAESELKKYFGNKEVIMGGRLERYICLIDRHRVKEEEFVYVERV